MVQPIYKKFNLEEATEILDATRDLIVEYNNNRNIDAHAFHSVAEYVGYHLFVLYADKGLITCERDTQLSLDGTEHIYEETVKPVRRRTR